MSNRTILGLSPERYARKVKELALMDKAHDEKFEKYLNVQGWRSKHKLLDPYELGNQSSSSRDSNESTESFNTSGEYHGFNPRFDLFPDANDHLDSFDGETDRLSLLSSRTNNSVRNNSGYEHVMNQMGEINEDDDREEGENEEQVYENTVEVVTNQPGTQTVGDVESDEFEEVDVPDEEEETEQERTRSFFAGINLPPLPIRPRNPDYEEQPLMKYFGSTFDKVLTYKPMRKNEFEYRKLDKMLRRKRKRWHFVNDDLDHGNPLNSADTWDNYDRSKGINIEFNYSNLDNINEAENPMFALENQPAKIFENSSTLSVDALSEYRLKIPNLDANLTDYYKSNLSLISKFNDKLILIVLSNAKMNLFEFVNNPNSGNQSDKTDQWKYIGFMNISFQTYDEAQYYRATNPNVPFSSNYIYETTLRIGEDSETEMDLIMVANDFSQVLIFEKDELLNSFLTNTNKSTIESNEDQKAFWANTRGTRKELLIFEMQSIYNSNTIFRSKTSLFKNPLRLFSSCWCISSIENYLAISDNSKQVTLFEVNQDGVHHKATSKPLSHNIPFIDMTKIGRTIAILAATYSGLQYILSYEPGGTLLIADAIQLDGPVWSCKFIPPEAFLEVKSFELLNGSLTSAITPDDILNHSELLGMTSNKNVTSDLGIAKYFTHLKIPSLSSRKIVKQSKSPRIVKNENIQFQRKREIYDRLYTMLSRDTKAGRINGIIDLKSIFGKDSFFITCTNQSLGFFNTLQMINLGSCKNPFPILDEPYIVHRENGLDLKDNPFMSARQSTLPRIIPFLKSYLNRIYFIRPMFSINAIALGNQAGQVSIYRLCKFRGLHSLRLEFVLIDIEKYIKDEHDKDRTLIGLSVNVIERDISGNEVWLLTAIFNDFITLNYKVKKNPTSGGTNPQNDLSILTVL